MSSLFDSLLKTNIDGKYYLTPELQAEARKLWNDTNIAIMGAGTERVDYSWAASQADGVVREFTKRFGEKK